MHDIRIIRDIPAIRPGMDLETAAKLAGRDCPPTFADKCPSRFQAISNAAGARQML